MIILILSHSQRKSQMFLLHIGAVSNRAYRATTERPENEWMSDKGS